MPNPWIEQDEEKVSKILASVARANVLFLLACERLGIAPARNAIHELSVPQVNARAEIGAVVKIGTLYLQAVAGLFEGPPDRVDAFLSARVPRRAARGVVARVSRVRLVPLVENVGALAHLPDLLEAYYQALERNRGASDLPAPGRGSGRGFDATTPSCASSSRCRTPRSRAGRSRRTPRTRWPSPGATRPSAASPSAPAGSAEPPPRVTFLIGAGRAGFRGGFDPEHEGVVAQFARADGVTLQGIRADAPAEAARLAAKFREAAAAKRPAPSVGAGERESLLALLDAGVKAHTETLLRIAPLLAPFSGLVPQTRVRIRATGSVNYGRSIPVYPEEWGGGTRPSGQSRPEGRVARGRDAAARDQLQPRLHDARPARRSRATSRRSTSARRSSSTGTSRATARSSRASCRYFVRDSVALVFGKRFAEAAARRCLRAAAAVWADVRVPRGARRADVPLRDALPAVSRGRLRQLGRDEGAREPHDARGGAHPRDVQRRVRARSAPSVPGARWTVLQTLVDAEEAPRLLLARELTIEEKREFVDLRIEGWLRTLPDPLGRGLRRAWAPLRELGKDDLTLRAIEQIIALEKLRGSRGA